MATDAHNQLFFVQTGCRVVLGNPIILHGNDVPCTGTTCDRQVSNCKGCIGKTCRRNFVLQCDVEVENQHNYNSSTGIADFTFRSWTFTKFVLRNCSTFASFDVDVMKKEERAIEESLEQLSTLINENNGWTVIGWHKRGASNATGDSRTDTIVSQTKGHLIRLHPTSLPTSDDFATRFTAARFYYDAS